MNQIELLNYAISNGIIDIGKIAWQAEMDERKKYLNMHRNKIWTDEKGRINTYLPGEKRKLIRKKTLEEVENIIIEYYKSQEAGMCFKNIFDAWLKAKLDYGEITNQTGDRYTTAYKKYFDGSEISKIRFDMITENMLEDYIKRTIHDKQLTNKAWADMRLIIYGCFRYAKKHGFTEISITEFMGDLDLSRKAFTKRRYKDDESVFTNAEIEQIEAWIYKAPPSLINYGILLAFQTGLRAGEIAALKYSDVKGNILTVQRTEIRFKDELGKNIYQLRESTKGRDGIRQIILTQGALDVIEMIKELSPGEYMFMNDIQIKGYEFTRKLYKICDHLKIKRRSLHKARKTYATKLLNAGVSERIIINQMGHTDISTTKGFYFFNNYETKEVEKMIETALM